MKFHEIGDTELFDCPEACRAIADRRLERVRRVLRDAHAFTPAQREEIERQNFLTFGEYLTACDRVQSIRERDRRIDNLERKKQHDSYHAPDKPKFYQDYEAPTPLEIAFARGFNPDRYTQDLTGYLAYVASVSSPLQTFFYRRLPVLIPEDARKRHTYITGQSGSGKSELLKALVFSYVRKAAPVSLVVIDPHGDFAEQIARCPSVARSGRLVFINPALAAGYTPTINPFQLADQSEAAVHVMAEQIASVFGELMRRSGHASLTGNMEALLNPCLSVLLRRPNSTILDLQEFMNDKRNSELIAAGTASPLPAHRDFFKYQFSEKRFESTKAALATRIQSLLNSPVLYRLLVGASTVDLEAAMNAGKIIIFALPKGGIGAETSPTFGAFVLAMLQGIAIRRENIPEHLRVPVHVFVDECQNFLTPSVQTILTESRKYGLHLTLAQQTFAQDMEKDLAAAVIGNTAIKFCGMNDVKTLKPMDERMGVGLPALQKLTVGRFFVKVAGDKPAVKVAIPLHPEHVTAEEWQTVKADQLGRYYRPHAKAATVANVQTGEIAEPASVQAEEPPPDTKKRPQKPPEHLKLV